MPSKKGSAKKSSSGGRRKRELVDTGTDKRYVRRDALGRFDDVVDVGRSLSLDRRRKAKASAKPGHGDLGDSPRRRAAKVIDKGAEAAGELGDRAAELTNSAVDAASKAARRVGKTAGAALERGSKAVKRATKSAARLNRRVAAAEAEVAKKALGTAAPAPTKTGRKQKGGKK